MGNTDKEMADTIDFDAFLRVDIRVGTIVDVRPNEAARKPSLILEVDFGAEIGRRKSSAQLTANYSAETLIGRQVAAVVNFPPKQIAKTVSEILVLGFPDENDEVVLLSPERAVPNGGRMY